MSYFIRVLGVQDPNIHLDEILDALVTEGLNANFVLEEDELPEEWSLIELTNEQDELLAVIERNPVEDEDFGKEELDEFRETILDFKPASAAGWLNSYFNKVKVIYAIQLLDVAFEEKNYPIVISAQNTIWQKTGGILQADGEGFSNEEGYHILWQFGDDVEGAWNCAVLNDKGKWENFAMELGDKKQQDAFLAGRVPDSATRL